MGVLSFNYNEFNDVTPMEFYLSLPNRNIIKKLNGITTATLTSKFNGIWEIHMEVDKYINNKLNPAYDKLLPKMEIRIGNDTSDNCIGWFRIENNPTERHDTNSSSRVYKEFTAYGYESQIQDIDLYLLYVNCGVDISREMFEENLTAEDIPKHSIQFYVKDEVNDKTSDKYWELGLLNILEHEYLQEKGWSIGHVDIGLSTKKGRKFEIDNQDLYSFLTQDLAKAYNSICIFNRLTKKIDFYDIKNVGKSLNIEVNKRSLINTAVIEDKNDTLNTAFRVMGANEDTLITYVNFGSSIITNYDYVISEAYYPKAFVDKYKDYVTYRDSKRQDYADTFKKYLVLQQEINELYDRVPIAVTGTDWHSYSLDELRKELEKFKEIERLIIERHTTAGVFEIDESDKDFSLYICITTAIIPNIELEITRKESGATEELEPNDDWKTNWELYGISELQSKKIIYQNNIDSLKNMGYDTPDKSEAQYNLYVKYTGYVEQIDVRLQKLEEKVSALEAQIPLISAKRQAIVDDVDINNLKFGFTEDELAIFPAITTQTDFEDSGIEVLGNTDIDEVISRAWELLDSAKEQLAIESRPQTRFTVTMDNIYHLTPFRDKAKDLDMGDFLFLELDGGYKTKQRIVEMAIELVKYDPANFSVTFSDVTTCYGEADDYRYIFNDSTKGSSKNGISVQTENYIKDAATSAANDVYNRYFGSGGSIFSTSISTEDAIKLADALNGLVGGELSLEELKVKIAEIDSLSADSAFIKYLNSQFIIGDNADFKNLSTLVASINNAIIGTSSTETGIVINLTSANATIDEAFMKQVIAKYIAVSDLKAGNINTDEINILSDDGSFSIVGNTMLFMDDNGNPRIQIGKDDTGNFTFVLYDETGTGVLIDNNGIHESAISDGLINNDMIADQTIDKSKFNFNIETDSEGNVITSIENIYTGEGGKFGVEYTKFKESIKNDIGEVTNTIDGVKSIVDENKQSITNKVWQTDITTKLNEYDEEIAKETRLKVSQVEQNLDSITSTISDIESDAQNLKTTVSKNTQTLTEHTTKLSETTATLGSMDSHMTEIEEKVDLNTQSISQKIWNKDIETAIDDISIGTVNLALGSGDFSDDSVIQWDTTNSSDWEMSIEGNELVITKKNNNSSYVLIPLTDPIIKGVNYTLSIAICCSKAKFPLNICLYNDATGKNAPFLSKNINAGTTTTLTQTSKINEDNFQFLALFGSQFSSGEKIYVSRLMMERGSIASDWSLSPVDSKLQITKTTEKINEIYNDLDGSLQLIQQTVNNKVDYGALDNYATNSDLNNKVEDYYRENIEGTYVTKNEYEATSNSTNLAISSSGGTNLIKNSIGFGKEVDGSLTEWMVSGTGTLSSIQEKRLARYGGESELLITESGGNAFVVYQDFITLPSQKYTIAFSLCYEQTGASGLIEVDVLDIDASTPVKINNIVTLGGTSISDYKNISKTFIANSERTRIRITVSRSVSHIAALRCNIGTVPFQWTLASGETYNMNVRIDATGLRVFSNEALGNYTAITPEQFAGYYNNERAFWMNMDETHMVKGVIEDELAVGNIRCVDAQTQVGTNTTLAANHKGLLFVVAN